VRNIKSVKVYSRSQQNSGAFADEMKDKLQAEIVAVATAEEAVRDRV
jgi:ornithine cyclodeaminase/alanine dehydrogenase-like protein (mu-crystallin family)